MHDQKNEKVLYEIILLNEPLCTEFIKNFYLKKFKICIILYL